MVILTGPPLALGSLARVHIGARTLQRPCRRANWLCRQGLRAIAMIRCVSHMIITVVGSLGYTGWLAAAAAIRKHKTGIDS